MARLHVEPRGHEAAGGGHEDDVPEQKLVDGAVEAHLGPVGLDVQKLTTTGRRGVAGHCWVVGQGLTRRYVVGSPPSTGRLLGLEAAFQGRSCLWGRKFKAGEAAMAAIVSVTRYLPTVRSTVKYGVSI